MVRCPFCGGMAVEEEFTRIDERGRFRVCQRRCVGLSYDRGHSRRGRKKPAGLQSVGRCGRIDVLSEDPC